MTVKVISEKPRIATCQNCNSILEYSLSDVTPSEGVFYQAEHIQCPKCFKDVLIKMAEKIFVASIG